MKLNIGDKIPSFSLTDSHGNAYKHDKFIGEKVVVIYFYPKNFTPGCTKEACDFRDSYEQFKDLGAEVIGISSDSEKSHQNFKKKYNLHYTFLSDSSGETRKKFGVKNHLLGLIPGRETFVFDKKGMLRLKFNSLNAKHHMEKALEAVKKINHE